MRQRELRQTSRICYLPHASAGTCPRMRTSWIQLRSRPSHHLATGEEMKSWRQEQRSRIGDRQTDGTLSLWFNEPTRGVWPMQAQWVSSCRWYLIAKQWGAPTPAAAHPGSHGTCRESPENSAAHEFVSPVTNLCESSPRRLLARAGATALRCARRLVGAAAS